MGCGIQHRTAVRHRIYALHRGVRCHRRLQRKVYACGARERESAVIHINLNHALKSQFDWAPPRVPLHLVAARRFDPPPCYRQAATSACRAFIVRATQPVGCVRVLGETKVAQWGASEIREHVHACIGSLICTVTNPSFGIVPKGGDGPPVSPLGVRENDIVYRSVHAHARSMRCAGRSRLA